MRNTVQKITIIYLLASQLGVKAGESKGERLEGRHWVLTVHCEIVLRSPSELHDNIVHFGRAKKDRYEGQLWEVIAISACTKTFLYAHSTHSRYHGQSESS